MQGGERSVQIYSFWFDMTREGGKGQPGKGAGWYSGWMDGWLCEAFVWFGRTLFLPREERGAWQAGGENTGQAKKEGSINVHARGIENPNKAWGDTGRAVVAQWLCGDAATPSSPILRVRI